MYKYSRKYTQPLYYFAGNSPIRCGPQNSKLQKCYKQAVRHHSPAPHLVTTEIWEENPPNAFEISMFCTKSQNLQALPAPDTWFGRFGAYSSSNASCSTGQTPQQYIDTQPGAWGCEMDGRDNSRSVWKGDGGNHNTSMLKRMPSDSKLWCLISKQDFLSKARAFQGNFFLGWPPRFMDGRTICISRKTHIMLNAPASTGTPQLWKTASHLDVSGILKADPANMQSYNNQE